MSKEEGSLFYEYHVGDVFQFLSRGYDGIDEIISIKIISIGGEEKNPIIMYKEVEFDQDTETVIKKESSALKRMRLSLLYELNASLVHRELIKKK